MHYASVVLGFLVITTFHIVLGEQAPKTLAIRFPLGTSLLIASPLRVFYVVFKPFIWILNTLSLKTLRVFGIPAAKDRDDDVHSEEELRLLVAESEEG
jgi:CBS domain containing-hemolysin-like protein